MAYAFWSFLSVALPGGPSQGTLNVFLWQGCMVGLTGNDTIAQYNLHRGHEHCSAICHLPAVSMAMTNVKSTSATLELHGRERAKLSRL